MVFATLFKIGSGPNKWRFQTQDFSKTLLKPTQKHLLKNMTAVKAIKE